MPLEERLPGQLENDPDLTLEKHFPDGWPLKKAANSHIARRGGKGAMEVAGEPLHRQAVGVYRRKRLPYLHDAPEIEGTQGKRIYGRSRGTGA